MTAQMPQRLRVTSVLTLTAALALLRALGCSKTPTSEQGQKDDASSAPALTQLSSAFQNALQAERAETAQQGEAPSNEWAEALGEWVRLCKAVDDNPGESVPFLLGRLSSGTVEEQALVLRVLSGLQAGHEWTAAVNFTADDMARFHQSLLKIAGSATSIAPLAEEVLLNLRSITGHQVELEAFYKSKFGDADASVRMRGYVQMGRLTSETSFAALVGGLSEKHVMAYVGALDGLAIRGDERAVALLIGEIAKGAMTERFDPSFSNDLGEKARSGLVGMIRTRNPRWALCRLLGDQAPKGGISENFDWPAWWKTHSKAYPPDKPR